MVGKRLRDLGLLDKKNISHIAVKESVFPFNKFSGVDVLLGPEMKSTGEVMGIDYNFGRAFAKSQLATGINLPSEGIVFISVKDSDKLEALNIAWSLVELGYKLIATRGTWDYFSKNGISSTPINKVKEGSPHVVESIKEGKINLVINTTFGKESIEDSYSLRRASLTQNLPYFTTLSAGYALVEALKAIQGKELGVCSLQEYGTA